MPEQYFTDPETGDPVAEATWDFAMDGIEVYYLGHPLTRLSDVVQLRTGDGITGPLPEGGYITMRLSRESGGESLTLERNGQRLTGSAVKWASTVAPGDIPPRLRDMKKRTGIGRKIVRFCLGLIVFAVAGAGGYTLFMSDKEKKKPYVPPVQVSLQVSNQVNLQVSNLDSHDRYLTGNIYDLPSPDGSRHGIS
jgi:hypothetical protein